jgi:hypothetical protein
MVPGAFAAAAHSTLRVVVSWLNRYRADDRAHRRHTEQHPDIGPSSCGAARERPMPSMRVSDAYAVRDRAMVPRLGVAPRELGQRPGTALSESGARWCSASDTGVW